MNSRNRLNLALLLLVVVLALVAVYEPGKEPPPARQTLTTLDPQAIRAVRIERRDRDTVVLERDGAHWRLSEPLAAPASDYRAGGVTRLAAAESLRRYPARGRDLAKFGLAAPQVRVTFDGTTTIALGDATAVDRRRYALADDTIHLIGEEVWYHLIGEATTFVSGQLLPPGASLESLALPGFTLARNDGRWSVQPEPEHWSADAVTALLDRWRHTQALEVRQQPPGEVQGERVTVRLAGQAPPLVYVVVAREPDLVLVRPDLGLRFHLAASQAAELFELRAVEEGGEGGR